MKRIIRAVCMTALLVGFLPVSARAEQLLIPVGRVIGIQLESGSVTVAAFDDVTGSRAREAGLRIGDEIIKIDDRSISCARDVRSALDSSGSAVLLTVRRSGKVSTIPMEPYRENGNAKLGLYLRQGIAGIGTVTWYDPESGAFGTLGHGVSDGKGKLVKMTGGQAYEAQILSVTKGRCGNPGQLKGSADAAVSCGTLTKNTPQGVFGFAEQGWTGTALPTAAYAEIQTGHAVIRSTVDERGPREYSVEILKIYPEDRSDCRNLLLRVTDPELLNTTGGIVQGMSGSPIIQAGKLVGAVTHVLVNDPTMGYGIFIENMLDAAG